MKRVRARPEPDPGQPAGDGDELELINYGAGYAWFRARLDAAIEDADRVDQQLTRLLDRRAHYPPEPRYVLTEAGRRALDADRRARAMQALFGQPWPSVAQACHQEQRGAA